MGAMSAFQIKKRRKVPWNERRCYRICLGHKGNAGDEKFMACLMEAELEYIEFNKRYPDPKDTYYEKP